MAKTPLKEIKHKRDGGGGAVLIVPHVVLNSEAYLTLSGRAIKLLYDIAMQYNTYNNGSLLASWRYMSEKRNWTSSDSLSKAKAELIERELIVQTVQGQLPNKASWYGLTWLALDNIKGLEITANHWPRGAYARWKPSSTIVKRKAPIKNCPVRTSDT
ncbi:MAG: hypothetical protein C0490_18470 [Marivirga sp.]|nr:hypothetical protein [Marivirga sp.]